jgi:hypothetical protein
VRPASLLRHPKDADDPVLVGVLGIGTILFLRFQLGVFRLEGVGDVLEEDQAEDDVFVLRRVHVIAQRIGRLPECGLETQLAAIPILCLCRPSSRHRASIL